MHVERLENAFEFLDEKPDALACEAIRGLVEDAEWAVKEKPGDEALDALLIGAASRVEHYEMAGYITAVRWATIAGKEEIASLLAETLEEEQAADAKLADLAEGGIDERALAM
jgi:ferritin-like metal-binding protein YciE